MTKNIPGPDPNLRKPKFVMPANACDTHCHVFGPADVFPYAPDRSYTPPDAPKEQLAKVHGMLGIARAVIVQASCHGTDNRATLDAIKHSSGRYRGVAIVDDSFNTKQAEFLHEGGIRGVRFNFVKHLGGVPDMDVFRRVVERIRPLGWHLVVHMDAGDLVEFHDMLKALPVPFIVDHMGRVLAGEGLEQPPFKALLDLMKLDNAWVKVCGSERCSTAGPPFTDSAPFAAALIKAAPDRVIWGTDWPHPNVKVMPNDADLVDLIPLFAPDEATQRRILVENPTRLYDFTA
ncbi:MAG TPA: amidohydrolase family protein [Stellaceae bacterium]|nr:amidohydrolase family protein [Stellaceae bacterium]